jgi:hypothetical protein
MNAPKEHLRALRELPALEPSPELVERVRRRAHADLAGPRGPASWITLAWTRVGLPVALVATVVGYLTWAFESASALYR